MLGCCSAIQLVEEGGGDVRGEAAWMELVTQGVAAQLVEEAAWMGLVTQWVVAQFVEEGGGDDRGEAVGRELVTQFVEE